MKKIIIPLLIASIIMSINILAAGELAVELGKPELLPRTGFEQEVYIPFSIKNVGDQPVTSRFLVKSFSSEDIYPTGAGAPLYLYTADMKDPNFTPNPQGVPIHKADGTIYFQKAVDKEVLQLPDAVVVAPTVTLQPGESLAFDQQGLMNSFYVAKSGTYTFGYEVDPDNEIQNITKKNGKATITLDVGNPNMVKGPNDQFKLAANQYWFYFQDLGECVTVDIPQPTDVCLLGGNSFAFKMSVGGKQVTLYHFFNWWSTTKKVNGVSITAGDDGFVLTY